MPPKKKKPLVDAAAERILEKCGVGEPQPVDPAQFDEAEASFGDPVLDAAADVAKEMGGRFTDDLLPDPQALLDAALGEGPAETQRSHLESLLESLAERFKAERAPIDHALQPGRIVRIKPFYTRYYIREAHDMPMVFHRRIDRTTADEMEFIDCVVVGFDFKNGNPVLVRFDSIRLELHPDFLDFDANN